MSYSPLPPPTPEAEAARARASAHADEVHALRCPRAPQNLPTVPLAGVLLWGLCRVDQTDPVIGVLRAVRLDLEILTTGCTHVDCDTLEAGLVATTRRLDAGIEMLRRLHRAGEERAA